MNPSIHGKELKIIAEMPEGDYSLEFSQRIESTKYSDKYGRGLIEMSVNPESLGAIHSGEAFPVLLIVYKDRFENEIEFNKQQKHHG